MRIGFVCNEYPPSPHGGIGTLTQTLARALVTAGHAVCVVGLYRDVKETTTEAAAGVEILRLPEREGRLRWVEGRRRLYRAVAEWATRGTVNVVEVPDWQGWAAWWPTIPVPVVARLHGSATYFDAEMHRPTRAVTRYLEGKSLRRADAWCSVSRYTAEKTQALFHLSSAPQAILPNPVEIPPVTSWNRRRRGMVVFTGTLTEKKGVIQLIDAWRRLAPAFPDASLHLLGKDGTAPGGGSMTAYLRSRLDGSVGDSVQFHGPVPREAVLGWLSDARVAVFPSFAEAFAIAPLEAMAAGCPTIASSLGSGPELIDNGHDGLSVDPRHVEEIEGAIRRLLSDDTFSQELAAAGRGKIARQFSVDRLLPANVQFYRKCVVDHSRRAGLSPGRRASVSDEAGGVEKAARKCES